MLTSTGSTESIIQILTLLVLFAFVLGITYISTRYIAGFQKLKLSGSNISVIETFRIAPARFIQILKIGEHFFAVAVSKDSVTLLGELTEGELKLPKEQGIEALPFGEFLKSAMMKAKQEK